MYHRLIKLITNNYIKQQITYFSCKHNTNNTNNNSKNNSESVIKKFEDIPRIKSLPIIGSTLSLILNGSATNLHNFIDKRHQQLGTIFCENIGPVTAVFLSDPKDMRTIFSQEGKYPMHILPEAWTVYNKLYGCSRGLFFMDGEEWWHYRKILNKHLLKRNDTIGINNACNEVCNKFIKKLPINTEINDLEPQLYRLSIEIMIAILIGADKYNILEKDLEYFINYLGMTVHNIFENTTKLSLISANLASKLKIPRWNRFVKSVNDALKTTNLLVDKLLLEKNSNGLLNKMLEENITIEYVKKILVDFILAAGDTTAYSTEWLLYLLAKNIQIQNALYDELVKENQNMLLRNVIKESFRLYPVAPFLTRILTKDIKINNYNIPAYTLIVMSIYTSGRNSKHFKNPNIFEPNRWLRTDKNYNSEMQLASLPFAMGIRSCIGRKIAETQIQTVLAKIIENYRVQVCNINEMKIVLKMIAVPSEPLRLKLIKR